MSILDAPPQTHVRTLFIYDPHSSDESTASLALKAQCPSAAASGEFWDYCASRNPSVEFNWECSVEFYTSDDDSSATNNHKQTK